MGFDEGSINLDNPSNLYYAGQTVFGKLVFDQNKEKTFRGLYVTVKGFCKVHWTTTHTRSESNRSSSYEVDHDSYEVYFRHKMYLLGGETGSYNLESGHHEIPFQFFIPPNCPSSFEGTKGYIRYEIKAVVNRAFKFDQEKKCQITVVTPLDLNIDPYCQEPIEMSFEHEYCCCCFLSGTSETLIKVPVAGFCPGQKIPFEISCNNSSTVRIGLIRIYLKKEITFRAQSNPDTRKEEYTITECKQGPVPVNSKRNFGFDLEIPLMDVNNVYSCRFIDIVYSIKVVIVPDGCHNDSEGSRRIVIGTIPLAGFQDNITNPLQTAMPQPNISNQQLPVTNIGFAITTQPYANGVSENQPPYNMSALQYPVNPGPISNPSYPTVNQPSMATPHFNAPYPMESAYVSGAQVAYPTGSPYPANSPVSENRSAMQPPLKFGFITGQDAQVGPNIPLLPPGVVNYALPPTCPSSR